MTREEMATILARAVSAYPHIKFSSAITDAWMFVHGDKAAAQVIPALRAAMLAGTHFPTPGEVETYIKAERPLPTAEELWDRALSEAAAGRTWSQMRLKYAKGRWFIGALGSVSWDRVRLAPTDELHFVRRDFLSAYQRMKDQGEKQTAIEASGEALKLAQETVQRLPTVGGLIARKS